MTEENDEDVETLENDAKALWIQIDPYFYLTCDSYNPVILVRFTHPNQTRRSDGEWLNNRKWYFNSFKAALDEYAHQIEARGHRANLDGLDQLKQLASEVDDAFEKGLSAAKKFDDERSKDNA